MDESLGSIPSGELVARFARAAEQRDAALLDGDGVSANNQAAAMWEIAGELRRRDDRNALLVLLDAPNPEVRVWAAVDALHYAPDRAEPILVALTRQPVRASVYAEQFLDLWRQGRLPSP